MTGQGVRQKVQMNARSVAFDAGVAVAATAISFSVFFSLTQTAPRPEPLRATVMVALLLGIHGLSLTLRRMRPLWSVSLVLLSGLFILALGWPTVVLGITVVVSVYSMGSVLSRRRSLPALGLTALLAVAAGLLESDRSDLSTWVGNLMVLAVAWFIGDTVRSRREYAADLEDRNAELEQARDELAEKAVAEERMRIARELHDVIAHSMSLIAVQSGVGRHVIDTDPAEAKRSLGVIEDASRSALAEVRRVLGLLREQGDGAGLAPAPGLADLDGLIQHVEEAGIDVRLERSIAAPLAPALELTVYRIMQEGLTNILKHSGARRAWIGLGHTDGSIHVQILDDGNGAAGGSEGVGLRGMRERVELFGGSLEAGPAPEGGFRIMASIPLEGDT